MSALSTATGGRTNRKAPTATTKQEKSTSSYPIYASFQSRFRSPGNDLPRGGAGALPGAGLRSGKRLSGNEGGADYRRYHPGGRDRHRRVPRDGRGRPGAEHRPHGRFGGGSAGRRGDLHHTGLHDGRNRRPALVGEPAPALLAIRADPAGGRPDWRLLHHRAAPAAVRGNRPAVPGERGLRRGG